MSEIISKKYFPQILFTEKLYDLIQGCVVKVYITIKQFNSERGATFSYIQTIIKNHLYEVAAKREKHKIFTSIDLFDQADYDEDNKKYKHQSSLSVEPNEFEFDDQADLYDVALLSKVFFSLNKVADTHTTIPFRV